MCPHTTEADSPVKLEEKTGYTHIEKEQETAKDGTKRKAGNAGRTIFAAAGRGDHSCKTSSRVSLAHSLHLFRRSFLPSFRIRSPRRTPSSVPSLERPLHLPLLRGHLWSLLVPDDSCSRVPLRQFLSAAHAPPWEKRGLNTIGERRPRINRN